MNLFNCVKSTRSRTSSLDFFGTTTMGEHHCDGTVTGAIIPYAVRVSSCSLRGSLYAKGTRRGMFTQKGRAPSLSWIVNTSPGMTCTTPSNTLGNSAIRRSLGDRWFVTCWLGTRAICFGKSACDRHRRKDNSLRAFQKEEHGKRQEERRKKREERENDTELELYRFLELSTGDNID